MKKLVEVLPDKPALIERTLALVLKKIDRSLAETDRCTIALSGGSTPKPLYESLSQQPLPWEKIHIFWGDERYVSPDHPDSNQGMARLAWLDRVPFPPENIHAMPTDSGDPHLDAARHEAEIRQWFGVSAPALPSFDIVLLGMGDDGHTASLFPHTEALSVIDRCITVGHKDGQPRLTFTAPLIDRSRSVIFVVAGESKRPALRQVFSSTADPMEYPSRLIQPDGELWWLLDRAAGEELLVPGR
jgi:6-phosphogluconolactonase